MSSLRHAIMWREIISLQRQTYLHFQPDLLATSFFEFFLRCFLFSLCSVSFLFFGVNSMALI